MKTFRYLPLLFLLAGCAHKPVGNVSIRTLGGPSLPATQVDGFRYHETVKPYHVGRFVDPDDRLAMHEAHTLYRVEQIARWNLHRSPPGDEPVAALRPVTDSADAPVPTSDGIFAELNHQKEITRTVTDEANRLTATLQDLTRSIAETKAIARQNLLLKEQLLKVEQRLSILEEQLHHNQAAPSPVSAPPTNAPADWNKEP